MRFGWGFALFATAAFGQVMTTFAGADFVFTGDRKLALQAPFGLLTGVAVDPDGNPAVVDLSNCIAARIVNATTPNAAVAVLAGNGIRQPLKSGEGGPALSAVVPNPHALTFDTKGTLYILAKFAIYTVSQGVIRRIAGDGFFNGFSGDGGAAIKALIDGENGGIAVDPAGVVFFSDSSNHRIRRIDASGIISTIAGTGQAGFSGDGLAATSAALNRPRGLTFDAAGNLYFMDSLNNRVRRITPGGVISTVTNQAPNGVWVALDRSGTIHFSANVEVLKIGAGGVVIPVAGAFPGSLEEGISALQAQLNQTTGGVFDAAGNLYLTTGDRLRRISPNGIIQTIAGNGGFRYAGENVPATSASLNAPLGLAITATGIVYVAERDGARVRKIENGIVTTFAGNGRTDFLAPGFTPVPATSIPLRGLTRIKLDAAGNLLVLAFDRVLRITPGGILSIYADIPNPCVPANGLAFDSKGNLYVSGGLASVCKIDSAQKGSIFVGTGMRGFAGDGGPAILANLSNPDGLAVDSRDILFISDQGNHRIRAVNAAGVINTVIGTGTPGFSGDGGPAISAQINLPTGLTFDADGNLLLADAANRRIRKITPQGVISTLAGRGSGLSLDDGKPALEAVLPNPQETAFDRAGNLFISDPFSGSIREVLVNTPTMQVTPASISFSGASGGAPSVQSIVISGSIPGLDFSAAVDTGTSGRWLAIESTRATTPRQLTLNADPATLARGSYTATVTITPAASLPAKLVVNVTFEVGPAQSPQLNVDKDALSFTFPRGATARAVTVLVTNAGGGQVNFTTTATTNAGGSWLSVAPASGRALPARPANLSIAADPAGLAAGTYTGAIRIDGGAAGVKTIPVTLTVSGLPQALLLTQTGLSFTTVAQGGLVPSQSFGVVNPGTGTLNWTASTSTLSGGPNWLTITPTSGSSTAGLSAPLITINVRQDVLPPGTYYGLVRVTAPGAANTPQVVTVFLEVLPAGSDPGAEITPSELVFTTSHGSIPGSQQLLIYGVGAAAKTFRSSFVNFSTLVLPSSATLNPSEPLRVTIQPLASFLTSGPVNVQDSLSFQFSDGRVKTVRVTLISSPVPPAAAAPRTGAGCTPTRLIPSLTSLGQSFAVSAGWPVGLAAEVRDDCGDPHTSGTVTVSFSNGDVPLSLRSLSDGTWQATWQTRSVSTDAVSLRVDAVNSGQQLSGTREITGGFRSQKEPPAVLQASVGSAAGFVSYAPLAPGGIISIYGDRLADNTAENTTVPLATRLSNTEVIVAGQSVPLFFVSQNQINAQVPFDLTQNTIHQVLVLRGLTYSQPVPIDVGPAQPAAFLSSGNAIAVAFRGTQPGFLVSKAAPAQAGDVLVLYAAGLGPTNQNVATGGASPTSPVASTLNPVAVTIGGVPAEVQFAGLTPAFVGLYQINLVVPAGVTPGESVPLVISTAGLTSPPAPIAIQ